MIFYNILFLSTKTCLLVYEISMLSKSQLCSRQWLSSEVIKTDAFMGHRQVGIVGRKVSQQKISDQHFFVSFGTVFLLCNATNMASTSSSLLLMETDSGPTYFFLAKYFSPFSPHRLQIRYWICLTSSGQSLPTRLLHEVSSCYS